VESGENTQPCKAEEDVVDVEIVILGDTASGVPLVAENVIFLAMSSVPLQGTLCPVREPIEPTLSGTKSQSCR